MARDSERSPRRIRTERVLRPATYVVSAFLALVVLGTFLLLLPIAHKGPGGTDVVTAFFTSVSAVTVTGLTVVGTGEHWSGFGEAVLLLLIQAGGLGISTGTAIVAIVVFRRLGLKARIYTSTESGNVALGDVGSIVRGVAVLTFTVEAVISTILMLRFWLGYDYHFGKALWHGVFNGVSSFNNAGFSLASDSLVAFAGDGLVLLPISFAVILGGIGVPVLYELRRRRRRPLSMHSRVTLWMTGGLLLFAPVAMALSEWTNPATLGDMPIGERLLNAWFLGVNPRSGGFNAVDYGEMRPESWLLTDMLMFVGGGSVSTAGGIRVTTLAVLLLVVRAQARGDRDATVSGRRLGRDLTQQALLVIVIFAVLTVGGTLLLMALSDATTGQALFEVISAISTCGLSTGITAGLGEPAQVLLALLMFVGRVGPVTLATALALRQSDTRYRYPEGRVLLG
ncbi:MAG: TrkH family potassium uptake protein [Actinomycetia bacterium]|nr:TrkH family potassium uptake protein [Actinomycetes bacterium]